MAKKVSKAKKFTFTDLADDDFVNNQFGENNNNIVENNGETKNSNINFSLSDLKNSNNVNFNKTPPLDRVNDQQIIETNETIFSNNQDQKLKINEVNIENKTMEEFPKEIFQTNLEEEKNKNSVEEITVKQEEKHQLEIQQQKKVYEVDYDDIIHPEKAKESKLLENLFEKKDPIKELFSTKNDLNTTTETLNVDESDKRYSNLKPRSTLKTYNEAIKNQATNAETNHFEENKIKQFLNIKEKLEVKTNIYLKNSIVIKLKELEERTNESRSSIINKLIEIALKNIEE